MKRKLLATVLGLTMLWASSLSCLAASQDYGEASFGDASTEVTFEVNASDLGGELIVSLPSEIVLNRVKDVHDPTSDTTGVDSESGYYGSDYIFAKGMVNEGETLLIAIADDGFAHMVWSDEQQQMVERTDLVYDDGMYGGYKVYFSDQEQGFTGFRDTDSGYDFLYENSEFCAADLRNNIGVDPSTLDPEDDILNVIDARIGDSEIMYMGEHSLTLTYNITVQ